MRALVPLACCLLLASWAGCLRESPDGSSSSSSSTSPAEPCAGGYVVGCDGNPDARRLLEEFGLHQMTNVSGQSTGLQVDAGQAVWMQEGYHAYDLDAGRERVLPYEAGQTPNLPWPSGCCVFYTQTPYSEAEGSDFLNVTAWVWEPATGRRTEVPLPPGPYLSYRGGFDGRWAVVMERSQEGHDGLTAVRADGGASRVLFPAGPLDGSPYGTPQVGAAMADGSAFLNFLSSPAPGRVASRIVEHVLDTGEQVERLRLEDAALTRVDASPRYVVAASHEGDRAVWVMDRGNRTWWNVQRDPEAVAVGPSTGGDWVVYDEVKTVGAGGGWQGGLVGIHLPTGARKELLPVHEDLAIAAWDTDGRSVVLQVELAFATRNAAYPGTQLYWLALPEP